MANNYFRFKQFTVHQDRSAMKVCTDSCLFGAWVAWFLRHAFPLLPGDHILDIGAGTGLLSLMLAQESPAQIEAVELDEASAQQAAENFGKSPWAERIHIHQIDIKEFNRPDTFRLVISNPPFFGRSLPSPLPGKNLAKHESGLELGELFRLAYLAMTRDGCFALLLPAERAAAALEASNRVGMFLLYKTLVKQTGKHDFFRVMLIFSKQPGPLKTAGMAIQENGRYSRDFEALLQPYYLKL